MSGDERPTPPAFSSFKGDAAAPSFSSFKAPSQAARDNAEAPTGRGSSPEHTQNKSSSRPSSKARHAPSGRDSDEGRLSKKRKNEHHSRRHREGGARSARSGLQDHSVRGYQGASAAALDITEGRSPEPSSKDAISLGRAPATEQWEAVLYIKDTTGDVHNAQYGPSKHSVPRFRRGCGGRVLGLDDGLRIASHLSDAHGLVVAPRGRAPLRYTDASRSYQAHRPPKRRIQPSDQQSSLTEDFIEVRPPKAAVEHEPTLRLLDRLEEQDHDEDAESDSIHSSDGADPAAELRLKVTNVNRAVAQTPGDSAAWLALAEIQRVTALEERNGSSSAGLSRAVAEAQISVLDRGLKNVQHEHKLRLRLQRLHIATVAGLWKDEAIEREWRDVLAHHHEPTLPNSDVPVQLWQRYIAWRSSQPTWTFSGILDVFREAFTALDHNRRAIPLSQTDQVEEEIVGLQLQLALTMRSAGYSERGFALLQAQAQLCESMLGGKTLAEAKAETESMWDAESIRFAEPLAARKPATIPMRTSDQMRWWLAIEQARSAVHCYPTRSTDAPLWDVGETDLDPFSSIFWSDVADFLGELQSEQARLRLVDAMLQYTGLPADNFRALWPLHSVRAPLGSGPPQTLSASLLLDADFQGQHFWPALHSREASPDTKTRLSNPFQYPHAVLPPDGLCNVPHLGLEPKHFSRLSKSIIDGADVVQARQVLRSARERLRLVSHDVELRTLEFNLDLAQSTMSLSKTARKALSSAEKPVPELWLSYAKAEELYGKRETAQKTLSVTLGSGECSSEQAAQFRYNLARFNLDTDPRAAADLIDAAILETGDLDECRSSSDLALMAQAQALQYLKSWLDEPSRRSQRHALGLTASSMAGIQPSFVVSAERLLVWDVTWKQLQNPRDLSLKSSDIIRSLVRDARETCNSAFPALLAAHELPRRYQGGFRLALDRDILPAVRNSEIASASERESMLVFAIYAEANLYTSHSNEHAVRWRLEAAIAESAHSQLIWHLYVSFELRLLEQAAREGPKRAVRSAQSNAKDVFYRALRAVPGDKALRLQAFSQPLRSTLSSSELEAIARTLEEREFRIFVPLDPTWCRRKLVSDGSHSDDEADSAEEIEERKRLMPY